MELLSQDYWEAEYNKNGFNFEENTNKENTSEDILQEYIEENNEIREMKEKKYSIILHCNVNNCPSCDDILVKDTASTLICNNCGFVKDVECNNTTDGGGYIRGYNSSLPVHRKIRMVGQDSDKFKSDLFRCGNSAENELQVKSDIIFEELVNIQNKYLSNKKNTSKIQISKNNLKDVAIYYTLCTIPSNGSITGVYSSYGMTNERDIKRYTDYVHRIQNRIYHGTKKRTILRNSNKNETLAALLFYVCLTEGFTCPKSAISEMFLLEKDGFASGEKYVRFFISQKKIDLDLNISRIKPEINTLFNNISMFFTLTEDVEEEYKGLKDAVCCIHEILEKKYIAERSCVKSQVIGASYIVIKRVKNKKLIPQMPDIVKFCGDRIRKSTVEKFIVEMNSHHSEFVEVYRKFSLDDSRW
jgi:transcription elongation factor Elf1